MVVAMGGGASSRLISSAYSSSLRRLDSRFGAMPGSPFFRSVTRELGATTAQLQWVVDAYSLVFAALLLTSGSLSDRFGRKGMLMAGLLVFGIASFAGGYATTPGVLIADRAVMGLGAAMTFP